MGSEFHGRNYKDKGGRQKQGQEIDKTRGSDGRLYSGNITARNQVFYLVRVWHVVYEDFSSPSRKKKYGKWILI